MIRITATDLHRFMQCNGSRIMAPSYPVSPDYTARDEGNAADWVATVLHDGTHTIEDIGDRKAPNGVYVTSEMIDYVSSYLAALDPGDMQVDTSFSGPNWTVPARADHVAWLPDTMTLKIGDLKYGHRFVEPDHNWTLIAHAIGTVMNRQIVPQRIDLTIYQPRPHHPDGKFRTWSIGYQTLLDLYATINDALSNPSDALVTGPACGTCHALATCPAARAANMNAIDAIEQVAFDDRISDDELSYQLGLLECASTVADQRLDALKELAMHRIRGGNIVPGRALENQLANTRWKSGLDPSMMTAITGIDLSKPGLVTPAEAKRRGVDPDTIALFTERPITGTKLVKRDASKHASRIIGGN